MAPLKSKKSGKAEGMFEFPGSAVSSEVQDVRRKYKDLRKKAAADEKMFEDLKKCVPCGASCLAAAKLRLLVLVEAAAKEAANLPTIFDPIKNKPNTQSLLLARDATRLLLEGANKFGSLPCALLVLKLVSASHTLLMLAAQEWSRFSSLLAFPDSHWEDPANDLVEFNDSDRLFAEKVDGASLQQRIQDQRIQLIALKASAHKALQSQVNNGGFFNAQLTVPLFKEEMMRLVDQDATFAPAWREKMHDNKRRLNISKQKKAINSKGNDEQEEKGRGDPPLERKKPSANEKREAEAREAHVKQVVDSVIAQLKAAGPDKAFEALQDLFTLSPQEVNDSVKDKQKGELKKLLDDWGAGKGDPRAKDAEYAERALAEAFQNVAGNEASQYHDLYAQVSTGLSLAYTGSLPQDLSAVEVDGQTLEEKADMLAAAPVSGSRSGAGPTIHPMMARSPGALPPMPDRTAQMAYDCIPEEDLFENLEDRFVTRSESRAVLTEDERDQLDDVVKRLRSEQLQQSKQDRQMRVNLVKAYKDRGRQMVKLAEMEGSPDASEARRAVVAALLGPGPCRDPNCQDCAAKGFAEGGPAEASTDADDQQLAEQNTAEANGKHMDVGDAGCDWGIPGPQIDSDDEHEQDERSQRKKMLLFISRALHILNNSHQLTHFLVDCLAKFTLAQLQPLLKDERSRPTARTVTWEHLTLLDPHSLAALKGHLAFALGMRTEAIPYFYEQVDAVDEGEDVYRTDKGLALRINDVTIGIIHLAEEAPDMALPEAGLVDIKMPEPPSQEDRVLQVAEDHVRLCFSDDMIESHFAMINISDEETLNHAYMPATRIMDCRSMRKRVCYLEDAFNFAPELRKGLDDNFKKWMFWMGMNRGEAYGSLELHHVIKFQSMVQAFIEFCSSEHGNWISEELVEGDPALLEDLTSAVGTAARLAEHSFFKTTAPHGIYPQARRRRGDVFAEDPARMLEDFRYLARDAVQRIGTGLRRLLLFLDVTIDVEVIHARQWLEWTKHQLQYSNPDKVRVCKALVRGIREKLDAGLKKDQEAESQRMMDALLAEEASTEQQAKGQQSKKKKKGKKAPAAAAAADDAPAVPEKAQEQEEEEAVEAAEQPGGLSPSKEEAARKAAEYAQFEASLREQEVAGSWNSKAEDADDGWIDAGAKSSNRNRRRGNAASIGEQAQAAQGRGQNRAAPGANAVEERSSEASAETSSGGKKKKKRGGRGGQRDAEEAEFRHDAAATTSRETGPGERSNAGNGTPRQASGGEPAAGAERDGSWESGRRPHSRAMPQEPLSEDGWVHVQPDGEDKGGWERAAQEQEADLRQGAPLRSSGEKKETVRPQERSQGREPRGPREDRRVAREVPPELPKGCFHCEGPHNISNCPKVLNMGERERAQVLEKIYGPKARSDAARSDQLPKGCLACGHLGHSYRDCSRYNRMSSGEKAKMDARFTETRKKDCYFCHGYHDLMACPKLSHLLPKDQLRRLATAYRVHQTITVRQILADHGLEKPKAEGASIAGKLSDLAAGTAWPAPGGMAPPPPPSATVPSSGEQGSMSWASKLKGEQVRPPTDDRRRGDNRATEQDAAQGLPPPTSKAEVQQGWEAQQPSKQHAELAEAAARSPSSSRQPPLPAGERVGEAHWPGGIAGGIPVPPFEAAHQAPWADPPQPDHVQKDYVREYWDPAGGAVSQGPPRTSNDRHRLDALGSEDAQPEPFAQDDSLRQPSWQTALGVAENRPFEEQKPASSPRPGPGPPGFGTTAPGPPPGFAELPHQLQPPQLAARGPLPRPIEMDYMAGNLPEAPDEDDDAFNDLIGLLVPTSAPPAKRAAVAPEATLSEDSATTNYGRTSYVDTLNARTAYPPQPSLAEAQEEEELERAIQASLAESSKPNYAELSTGESALRLSNVNTPGLANDAGAYNCFLNCVVQCLWQCTELREALQTWGPLEIQDNAVVAGLVELFKAFAAEEAVAEQRAGAGRRQAVTPQALREALAAWGKDTGRFAEGQMHDAAEMLDAVFDNLCGVEDGAALVERIVQWHVHEYVHCSVCQKTSHDISYRQYYYTTFATALREEMAIDAGDGDCDTPSLGSLLSRVQCQHEKSCDTDNGGCGRMNIVTHGLAYGSRPRRVFTLQLGWERAHETSQDIADTLATIQERLDVAEVFAGGKKGRYMYALRSMVAYYGSHYHAFVQNPETGLWRSFDDMNVSEVGDWQDVLRKCHLGKIQPSVLFYEADS